MKEQGITHDLRQKENGKKKRVKEREEDEQE